MQLFRDAQRLYAAFASRDFAIGPRTLPRPRRPFRRRRAAGDRHEAFADEAEVAFIQHTGGETEFLVLLDWATGKRVNLIDATYIHRPRDRFIGT